MWQHVQNQNGMESGKHLQNLSLTFELSNINHSPSFSSFSITRSTLQKVFSPAAFFFFFFNKTAFIF